MILRFLLLAVLVVRPATAAEERDADVLKRLRVGHWIEVRGVLGSDGFEADRLELRAPDDRPSLWGVLEEENGRLVLLGRSIESGPWTVWRGGDPTRWVGSRVKIVGSRAPDGQLWAHEVQGKRAGVERLVGRIDELERLRDGRLKLEVLGFEVLVPESVRQRSAGDPRLHRRVPPQALRSPSSQFVDGDDLFGEGYVVGDRAHIGLQQQLAFTDRSNFELDERDDTDIDDDDDRRDSSHSLRARLLWRPGARFEAVVDGSARTRHRDLGDGGEVSSRLRLNEAFLVARNVGFGLDLQVGRQDHDDIREWLFDQNLDGVRLFRDTRRLRLQLSASTTLSGGSARDRDAFNTIFYVSNQAPRRHLAAYLVDRRFGGGRDEIQTHVGARFFGPLAAGWRGWLELSALDGRRDGRPVRAFGGDLGLTWSSRSPRRWTTTFGFAHGSGDRGGSYDGRFRQTGLQDNNGRVGGLTAVRYYGEIFDPELTNLQIATIGFGMRPLRRTSVEILAHRYWQDVATRTLGNSDLDRRANGVDRDLGWEVDLVLGLRRYRRWDLELVFGRFEPGPALEGGDAAHLANLQVRLRY